ncbi:aldose epimerase family protein [Mangrovicella endophytica]|uniref:aldose epimerase family protein n=1 Tax=Mangrovicella endophytica TaxID=2066697 RepID=UPI000C9DE399|nr:aldose epimerase family protein [Mangrovicella endophytica]
MGAIERSHFGTLSDGQRVEAIDLRGEGIELRVITYGAAIQALRVPDRSGAMGDVVLGYPDLDLYETKPQYFGGTIGRYANRIAAGRFELDGRLYQVEPNDGPNALHGGAKGFDKQVWTVAETGEGDRPFVVLERTSPDGEEGFPGELKARVRFTLSAPGELTIGYEATTDRPTLCNLTNHSYFNLGGVEQLGTALNHRLQVMADRFLPIDATAIPNDGLAPVEGTPFDFRQLRRINDGLRNGASRQIVLGRGYDHSFVLSDGMRDKPALAARVEDEISGRAMELWTTEPGLQVYSGNFLDATTVGKFDQLMRQGDAFCLEPQHHPDTPSRSDVPSARLDPGKLYRSTSIYRFANRVIR